MAKDQYYHEPLLNPRYIRIIHLLPAQDPSDPLRCRLVPISLDDHLDWDGDYTAVSYSWDAQRPSRNIECHDGSLLITANCESALRHLRHSSDVAKLWIDSICIDQTAEGIKERSSQVALMGQIYKCASKVVVWLGESDAYIKAALDAIDEIVSPVQQDAKSKDRRQAQKELHDRVRALANSISSKSEDPLGFLFERNWFHRMWTVQEATLSWIDRLELQCGQLQLKWTELIVLIDALGAAKYPWSRWREAMSVQKQLTIYLTARRYTGAKKMLDDNPGSYNEPLVFSILSNARRKKSGDPKDKIFALYGLFSELEIPFPLPDYSLSVDAVYREAVIASINHDKNLYLLYYAPSDKRRDTLASWVPDWAEDGWEETDSRHGLLRDRFKVSKSAEPRWSFSKDGMALTLKGKIIDTVIFRNEALLNGETDLNEAMQKLKVTNSSENSMLQPDVANEFLSMNHQLYTVLRSWVETSQWSEYPTGEPSKTALQRTLVNDNPDCNDASAKDDAFEHWHRAMCLDELGVTAAAIQNQGLGDSIPQGAWAREEFLRRMRETLAPEVLSFYSMRGAGSKFQSLAMAFSQKKAFFYTENAYFGTTAESPAVSIRPGDKIAVVSGLSMPLALRPVEGGYRLVTHVYMHGVMYGEAWPESVDELVDIILL